VPTHDLHVVKHPEWLEITVDADALIHDALSDFLFALGCQGIVAENTRSATLVAYFTLEKLEEIQSRLPLFFKKLEEIFPEARPTKLSIGRIEDQDWGLAWRRFFRTEQVTPDLLIVPAWEKVPLVKDVRVIRMDPGPAFGTGQHATTRMCLEMMETFRGGHDWDMLDVGTGSGILAIYGAILGAEKILALDTDLEALRWAKRNIALNQLPVSIEVSDTPVEEVKDTFHLLAANLILHVIQGLIPHFSRLLQPRGWLILSGLIKDQVEGVWVRLSEQGIEPERVLYREEWACILAVKEDVKSELMHS
jgi:ribosomal protein L11 methyltransferase